MITFSTLKEVCELAKNIATTVGIVAGGIWAFFRFVLERRSATALELDLIVSTRPLNGGFHLTMLDAICKNVGQVRLAAKRAKEPAFEDLSDGPSGEELPFSFCLECRQVRSDLSREKKLDWWNVDDRSSQWVKPFTVVNLLVDYEKPGDGLPDFWLEPQETYHLLSTLVLRSGFYQAMLTFVGAKDDRDFWRRRFLFVVPAESNQSIAAE